MKRFKYMVHCLFNCFDNIFQDRGTSMEFYLLFLTFILFSARYNLFENKRRIL